MDEAELNLLDIDVRIRTIAEIKSEDNYMRKRDQQRRYDVYNDKQDVYILERLRREFSEKTVSEMRKILSINLAKRIIDEKSSVYLKSPDRNFTTKTGTELTEKQHEQVEALYDQCNVDLALKRSNMFYNLQDQNAIMVVPDKRGKLKVRSIPVHHYDVVPSVHDPEIAHAYILNVWDYRAHGTATNDQNEPTQMNRYKGGSDRTNQGIADDDDRNALLDRYVVWTKEYHYVMDGKGNIIGEVMPNPIGCLPFIDVAPPDKDYQFFIRRGSSTVEFSLDYGMILSDNANVIRLQAYSQAVISSETLPTNLTVGPNHILHLKLDPNKPELKPTFEFVTPSPDLAGTQNFIESLLNLHLTSEGLDPSILSTKDIGQKFNSGLDRLLAMISRFEATRDDFSLFESVEQQIGELLVKWSNVYQDVIGEGGLNDDLKISKLPDDIIVEVKFNEPEATQTKSEREDSVIKLMNEGMLSKKMALMQIHDVSDTKALEIIKEIDEDDGLIEKDIAPPLPPIPTIEDNELESDVSTDIQEIES